jgi:hypothetical protein
MQITKISFWILKKVEHVCVSRFWPLDLDINLKKFHDQATNSIAVPYALIELKAIETEPICTYKFITAPSMRVVDELRVAWKHPEQKSSDEVAVRWSAELN